MFLRCFLNKPTKILYLGIWESVNKLAFVNLAIFQNVASYKDYYNCGFEYFFYFSNRTKPIIW